MKTIEPRQEALDALFEELFAEEIKEAKEPRSTPTPTKNHMSDKAIIQKALLAKDGKKFEDLWKGSLLGYVSKDGKPDPSAADMALMNKLAFWTSGNAAQMERLFSASMLGKRDKWIDRADYRDRTIKSALKNAKEFYKPPQEGPKLKKVSENSQLFAIGVTEEGTVAQLVETKKEKGGEPGETALVWLSDCPVYIATETIADDETEFTFKGKGAKDNREVCFKQSARDMAVDEKFEAALINAFGAKNRVGKLTFDIVQRITLNTKKMKRIAVPRWEGKIPLVPGIELMENVEYKLADQIPACVYDGDLKKSLKVLKCLMKVHKYAPLLVATILGAPIIAKEHKTKRFGFGIWGGTGTFKTSTATVAMCIYGVNYIDDPKLKSGKSGSTAVGAMEIFAAAGILPQIFDNVKAADPKDAINYVSIIQGILEGEEKARGKKDGGLRKGREFLTTPIITGEVKPQEAATSARVLNTNWVAVDGKLLREVQESVTLLPVIGYNWLTFLGTTKQEFAPGFGDYQSKLMTDFIKKGYVNPGRLATICTLLKSVWALLEVSPIGSVFKDMEKEFATALEEAAKEQGETTSEETEAARFMAGLNELLIGNPGLFVSKEGKKTVLGNVIGKWMDNGICVLPLQTLNELSKIKTFVQQPNVESMTMALDREKLLIPDPEGKLKTQMRINGGKTRGWYIRLERTTIEGGTYHDDGYRKTESGGTCTTVPPKNDENAKEVKEEKVKGESEKDTKNGGTGGTDIDNKLVDSDNSVPPSVPPAYHRTTSEEPKSGKRDMETPISESNLIRNAAILEHGTKGWIDARIVANKLKIPLVNVVNYLESTHSKMEIEYGYMQRKS